MSKLERYLEFNWPDLTRNVEGSVEDKAIRVMRKLDEQLGMQSPTVGIHTHSVGCWAWGKKHYDCALGEIGRLQARAAKVDRVEDVNRDVLKECKRLNAENERLRRVEDAALAYAADTDNGEEATRLFLTALDDNPRPEPDDALGRGQ